jgi:hypothetical protein
MRFSILSGLVPLLWLSAVGSRAADEPKSLTPAEKYGALVKTHQQAQETFSKAYNAAKTDDERQQVSKELGRQSTANHYAAQFLALIREHPKDPAALDSFHWLLSYLRYSTETDQAVDTLLRDWIEDKRLEGVCKSLFYYSCPAGDRLLRAAIAKSPHRAVQGHARFSLAVSLRKQADRLADHRPADREPYEREAEQLLQQVIDKYADLKHLTTLGKEAEVELFALGHLAVGKVAPDIEGEDLDGTKMKLTDFRGKVVLLTFWGSW